MSKLGKTALQPPPTLNGITLHLWCDKGLHQTQSCHSTTFSQLGRHFGLKKLVGMRHFLRKAFYAGTLLFALWYVGSYILISSGDRIHGAFVGSRGSLWAFSSVRMNVHLFTEDPRSPNYSPDLLRYERRLMRFYAPLVYLELKLFNNYHILHEDRPSMGG